MSPLIISKIELSSFHVQTTQEKFVFQTGNSVNWRYRILYGIEPDYQTRQTIASSKNMNVN